MALDKKVYGSLNGQIKMLSSVFDHAVKISNDTLAIYFTDGSHLEFIVPALKGDKGDPGENGKNGASSWNEISNKPFEKFSDSFAIENGIVKLKNNQTTECSASDTTFSNDKYPEYTNVDLALCYLFAKNEHISNVVNDLYGSLSIPYPGIRQLFELGNVYITTSGHSYYESKTRIRTKKNTTIHLVKGDVISLSSYENARYYVGWLREDGTYGAEGWFQEDYIVSETGEYVLLLSYIEEKEISDINDILDLLNIYSKVNVRNLADKRELADIVANSVKTLTGDLSIVTPLIEKGNIAMSKTAIVYGDSTTRIRTPKNCGNPVKKGWKISLDSKGKNAKYYVSVETGTSSFVVQGWNDSDYEYIVPVDGIVHLLARLEPESELSLDDLTFTITSDIEKRVSELEQIDHDVIINQHRTRNDIKYVDGFLAINGTISQANVGVNEKTSNLIKVFKDEEFVFVTAVRIGKIPWTAWGFYNDDRSFSNREVVTSITIDNIDDYNFTFVNINIQQDGYIRVSTRTYGDGIYMLLPKNSPLCSLLNMYILRSKNTVNNNIKSINHRGYNTIAPENTLSAYRLSKEKGFTYVETDISFTKDNVPVCLHDSTIDRTSNGSGDINSMTFEEVRQYDFGSWKSEKYAGELIPSFEEFVILCKRLGLSPYIELKTNGGYTEEQIKMCVDIVKRCGMKNNVTWISFSTNYLGFVKKYDSTARLGFVVDHLSETWINNAISLKTSENEVFMDTNKISDEMIEMCVNNNIPVEMWTIDSKAEILALDKYVSGVTSNIINVATGIL